PAHLRDLHRTQEPAEAGDPDSPAAERRRRIRDAVEAALSDVILLGTEEQVELAAAAARDMVAGRPVETAALVASLRVFIRQALDLEPLRDRWSSLPRDRCGSRPAAAASVSPGAAGPAAEVAAEWPPVPA